MSAKAQQVLGLPFFLPVLGAGLILALVATGSTSRRLREPWPVVLGLFASLSIVLAATLTPAPGGIVGPCLTAMAVPLGPDGLQVVATARSLNTWMLVPLGLFVGYLTVRRWWVLVVAVGVPFVIEAVQRLVPALGRRCQVQDIIDNLWGLALAVPIGLVLGLIVPRMRRSVRR